jgi:hypothetical protein
MLTLILAAPVHRGNNLSHSVLLSLGVTWHWEGQHLPTLYHVLFLNSKVRHLVIYLTNESLYPILGRAAATVVLVQEIGLYRLEFVGWF